MNGDAESLSDREREALRLLGRGHEAKSIASALDLSVHTVNERLRAARRKLGVSSSREAARLLLAHEAGAEAPKNVGAKKIGVAPGRADDVQSLRAQAGATGTGRRLAFVVIGAIMLTFLLTVLMTSTLGRNDAPASPQGPRPAQSIYTLPSLFMAADYPAEALAQGVNGSTGFRLQVSAVGRVEKCDVVHSSGSAALDQATCRVITSRARFRPALNARDRPIAAIHTGEIQWLLGEEPETSSQGQP